MMVLSPKSQYSDGYIYIYRERERERKKKKRFSGLTIVGHLDSLAYAQQGDCDQQQALLKVSFLERLEKEPWMDGTAGFFSSPSSIEVEYPRLPYRFHALVCPFSTLQVSGVNFVCSFCFQEN